MTGMLRVTHPGDHGCSRKGLPVTRVEGLEDSGGSQEKVARLVLADDHVVVRGALRVRLEAEPDLEVVAEAGSFPEVLRFVNGHKPDVLLLDLNMPGGSPLETIEKLAAVSPNTGVVVLTMQVDPVAARDAMSEGARGFLRKDASDSDLTTAIRTVAAGGIYLQPAVGAEIAAAPAGLPGGLSEREAEVLRLIALGNTNAEIAETLSLSVRTVESHRSSIQHKTGANKRSELVHYAIENDLIARLG